MSRLPFNSAVGALLVVAVCVPAASAVAQTQTPRHVRVVHGPAPIEHWFRAPARDALLEVEPGTTLEVLERDTDWFWVIVPRDVHGTRRAGWIRASYVEPVVPRAATSPEDGSRGEPGPLATTISPAANGVPATPAIAENGIAITERRSEPASSLTNVPNATKAYTFEDVHFDRDRSSLRPEDMDRLRAAVIALKTDPSLEVNISGSTCSLGTTAYNRALGVRRAKAVKSYLVSEGIAADRLHTVSLGEEHAKYDNSREETRQLNRRVALVPHAQP